MSGHCRHCPVDKTSAMRGGPTYMHLRRRNRARGRRRQRNTLVNTGTRRLDESRHERAPGLRPTTASASLDKNTKQSNNTLIMAARCKKNGEAQSVDSKPNGEAHYGHRNPNGATHYGHQTTGSNATCRHKRSSCVAAAIAGDTSFLVRFSNLGSIV